MPEPPIPAGSVCSGCGSLDLALERAGFSVKWQIEIDKTARSVLERHWPETKRYEDLRDVRPAEPVRLIAGGTPCQDLSVASRGAGLDGDQSRLFFDFIRLADTQPSAWILFENVPGLLSKRRGEDFAVCLEGFTGVRPRVPEGGWRNAGVAWGPLRWANWWCADSQYFGVPQGRRRVFVAAGPRGACGPELLFDGERVSRISSPGKKEAAVSSPCARAHLREAGEGLISKTVTAKGQRFADQDQLVVDLAQVTSAHNRSQPRSEICPTVCATSRLAVFDDLAIRRMTPREVERVQCLPDDWTAFGADGKAIAMTPRYRLVGNGVAVPHAGWIARRIYRALREQSGAT